MSGADDELIPFAESLGVAAEAGQPLELEPYQRALLDLFHTDTQRLDRGELELAARRTARRQAAARALAVAVLQGVDLKIASPDAFSRRRLVQQAIDELELLGRALGVDVGPARERLRALAD